MLKDQADGSNANPAAKAEDNRFASCFYQFHNVGIQSDGSHGNNNEKFAQFFDGSKNSEDTPNTFVATVVMMEATIK